MFVSLFGIFQGGRVVHFRPIVFPILFPMARIRVVVEFVVIGVVPEKLKSPDLP